MTTAPSLHRPDWAVPWAVAEMFAGVGSVARGFARAGGFQIAYLNDIDPAVKATYIANNQAEAEAAYHVGDVTTLADNAVLDAADGRPIAGLLGCPPCQGWSAAGQRDSADKRNALLSNFFDMVLTTKPVFFVMENVPSVADRAELAACLSKLDGLYRTWQGVLNAAAYGLPQSRQRTLVIGYHVDTGVVPTCPPPTHGGRRKIWDYRTEAFVEPSAETLDAILGAAPRLGAPRAAQYSMRSHYAAEITGLTPFVTTGEAIGDLEGDGAPSEPSGYARALGAGASKVSGHVPWNHGHELVTRMHKVPEGCRPPLDATNGRRYYSQAYTRLHRDGLARTITTNFHNPGSGRFLHYRLDRTLTIREAARIQGFRDDFEFTGLRGVQERQIGNAFPPLWAEAIAAHIVTELHDFLSA